MGKAPSKIEASRAAALCAALVFATSAVPAQAESFAHHGVEMIGTELHAVLEGTISANCQISGGGNHEIDLGELTGGIRASGVVGLDCNVPFQVSLTSTNGGLQHVTQPQGEGPFKGNLAYDARLTVPVFSPEPDYLVANLFSRNRSASVMGRDVISGGNATLEITTRSPEGAGLLAGKYTETLVIDIRPAV